LGIWTRTPLGIDTAVTEFNGGGRAGVPNIMIVITDGKANGGGSVTTSSNPARYSIKTLIKASQRYLTFKQNLFLCFFASHALHSTLLHFDSGIQCTFCCHFVKHEIRLKMFHAFFVIK